MCSDLEVGDFVYILFETGKVGPRRIKEISESIYRDAHYVIHSKDVGIDLRFKRSELIKCQPQENVALKLSGLYL
jgi:hypothetical protein